uniref:Endothelial cells scavenger receptor n=1 Tax=Magallana gigas TaxID=29159 RepID=K1P8X9_MAGGI
MQQYTAGPNHGYIGRFLGFAVYISNTTDKEDGVLCFKDDKFTRYTIPAVITLNCTHHGRYVIYYNNRTPNSKPKPPDYSEYAYNELCEFEVYGCPSDHFGVDCSETCPARCKNSRCHIDTGYCFECEDGYQGLTCEQQCPDGLYGRNCFQTCNKNCFFKTCDKKYGACQAGCVAGWKPPLCNEECGNGTFGTNCSGTCGQCYKGQSCDKKTGACCTGCDSGYEGTYCNKCKISFSFDSAFASHRALEYNNYGVLGDGVSGSNTTDNYVDKSHVTRAGTGRSGIFIALDYLYKTGKLSGRVNVAKYVMSMRKNRMNMVEHYEQYKAIFLALREAFKAEPVFLTSREFLDMVSPMLKKASAISSYIKREFETKSWIPSPSSEKILPPYRVVCNSCEETDLKLSTISIQKDKGKPFNVVVAEPKSDLGSKTQTDTSTLLSLVSFALSRPSNNPIAVFNIDVDSLFGVFCAVFNSIQQITIDDNIDVFTTVRLLMNRRPELCSTEVENIALHKSAWQLYPYNHYELGYSLNASKAVDGLKTNLSYLGIQCTESSNYKDEAMWRVDLGSVLGIHHITIYYRTDNAPWGPTNELVKRFLGFSVFISNTTERKDGVLCFKDNYFTKYTIPSVITLNCTHHGRYVIYYNNRTSSSKPSDYSEYAYNELCEFEVYACQNNMYGADCSEKCGHCRNGEQCHHVNGACPNGCKAGYFSASCKTGCDDGTFGTNCSSTCGHCHKGQPCDKKTGACPKECDPGYEGLYCNKTCARTNYGPNCNLTCSTYCFNQACDSRNGACLTALPRGEHFPCDTGKLSMSSEKNRVQSILPCKL